MGDDIHGKDRIRTLKYSLLNESNKSIGKFFKINFFKTVEINKNLATIWEVFI